MGALLLLLILLLVLVSVCCASLRRRRRRRRRQKKSEENHLYDHATASVGYSSPAGSEDKGGYAVIGKDSSEKNGHTLIMSNKASIKDVSGRERKSTVVESSTEGQGQSDHIYYNTVTGSDVYQNKQTVDEADEEMRGQQQPPVYSNAGKRGGSAENAAAAPATRTPRPPSQDYATIPDKELEEGLYDTADDVQPRIHRAPGEMGQSADYTAIAPAHHFDAQPQRPLSQDYATIPDTELADELYDTADFISPQEADTEATPLTADYASSVKPVQEGADDTEQLPPVPAFDPEILYTQPDKTSKAKYGVYENVRHTLGHGTVGDYDSVDATHPSRHEPLRASQETGTVQVAPLDPEELYTRTDKPKRTKRSTRRDPDSGLDVVDGTVAGQWGHTPPPAQDSQSGYAIPDKRKKRKKQAHSMGTPPEILAYLPTTPNHKQDNTK